MDCFECFIEASEPTTKTQDEERSEEKQSASASVGFSDANTSTNEMDIDVELIHGSIEDFMREDVFKVKTAFDRLMWTLDYLKSNPSQGTEDQIVDVCNGVEKMVSLSGLQLSSLEYKRFQRIMDALFGLVQTLSLNSQPFFCGESQDLPSSASAMNRIYEGLENIIDNLLDQINTENLSVETQLVRYSYIQGVLMQTEDKTIRKLIVAKLVLRIRSLAKRMWEAYFVPGQQQRPKSSGKDRKKKKGQAEATANQHVSWKMYPQDTNTFYFYCQMLETALTTAIPNDEKWIEKPVFEILKTIEDECGHGALFKIFPNFQLILYSTIISASRLVEEN